MWYPWYQRLAKWFYDKLIECPACNGDGGETEVILDDGTGPYYPCEFCKQKGWVGPYKHILWWRWTKDERKHKSKSLLQKLGSK